MVLPSRFLENHTTCMYGIQGIVLHTFANRALLIRSFNFLSAAFLKEFIEILLFFTCLANLCANISTVYLAPTLEGTEGLQRGPAPPPQIAVDSHQI